MALRDDINYAMMSEVQRFREELLTKEEQDQIVKDVMVIHIMILVHHVLVLIILNSMKIIR